MIKFDEGLTLCGRVTWGFKAGFITSINSRTYRVRWLDGCETEQLRPNLDDGEALDIETGKNPDGYWYALDRNTYDVDCDQDGFFSNSPVGSGKTEAEAIADLKEQIEEAA